MSKYRIIKLVIVLAATTVLSGCGATIYDPETLIKKMEKCLSIGMLPSITTGGNVTRVRCVEQGSL